MIAPVFLSQMELCDMSWFKIEYYGIPADCVHINFLDRSEFMCAYFYFFSGLVLFDYEGIEEKLLIYEKGERAVVRYANQADDLIEVESGIVTCRNTHGVHEYTSKLTLAEFKEVYFAFKDAQLRIRDKKKS
jgi:hypothetical protein